MKPSTIIRLIPSSSYAKNNLFRRLMTDFFYAVGYDDVRLNVPQVRRDVFYIQGQHKSKALWLRAECRLHANKRELKSFITSLNKEYREHQKEGIDAYFVLLKGNVDQVAGEEEQVEKNNFKLITGERVIRSLEESKLIISDERAALLADKYLLLNNLHGFAVQEIELLAHEIGYVKAVYCGRYKQHTHVALIHADGSLLVESIAREVIEDDKATGEKKQALHYLTPPAPILEFNLPTDEALAHYRKWLGEECGSIQLDGLPTDSDLGPRKLELERLFVPLNIEFINKADEPQEVIELADEQLPIGKLLTKAAHIAILASPGGGKSTLLKRLATAYAFPERRTEIDDNLPAHDWLPLFLRCRELQDKVKLPILNILEEIPNRVDMRVEESLAFGQIMREALQAGQVLLLVDGLDEISQEKDRVTFANNLRSFLITFPQTALVVTSREAGFRLVAGTIASVCLYTRLATFSEEDVQNLCVRWLTEVETDTPLIRQGALKLAEDIWESERIRALAVNPLLLTTLLVVKRWIGELPRNRAALYGVAVQVLVRTWNVEGYEPLDEQETLAQLSYVACAMMEQGIQQIPYNALLKLLNEARVELEAELQFARVSPAKFIERVESRSSLLMQTGRVLEDGELQPVYEFRHLTFQEYSAARGYAKEQHPRRNDEPILVDLLAPHFADERWREVIPLAVVMAERRATEATMKELIKLCGSKSTEQKEGLGADEDHTYFDLLLSCILDEVKLTSNTLTSALKVIACHTWTRDLPEQVVQKLIRSKIGELFFSIVEQEFTGGKEGWEQYGVAYGYLCEKNWNYFDAEQATSFISRIVDSLSGENRVLRIRAAIEYMQFCFRTARNITNRSVVDANGKFIVDEPRIRLDEAEVVKLYKCLNNMLSSTDWPSVLAVSWALAWAGVDAFRAYPANHQTVELLAKLWREAPIRDVKSFIAWGLAEHPLLNRDASINSLQLEGWNEFLKNEHLSEDVYKRSNAVNRASVTIAWYRRSPWSDSELVNLIQDAYNFALASNPAGLAQQQEHAFTLLAALGVEGEQSIQRQKDFLQQQWQKRQDSRRASIRKHEVTPE